MSFLVLINRGPVDDRVETILESTLMENSEFSDWQDFPQECIPPHILKGARDQLSQYLVNMLHEGIGYIETVIKSAAFWFDTVGYVAQYIYYQLRRIGISPQAITYVELQPNAIQLTLEC